MEPNPAWLFKKSTRLNMLTRTYVGYALRGKKQGRAYNTQQDPRRQFQAFNILYVVLCIVLCPLLILYPTRPRSVMVLRKVVAWAVNCFTIFFFLSLSRRPNQKAREHEDRICSHGRKHGNFSKYKVVLMWSIDMTLYSVNEF